MNFKSVNLQLLVVVFLFIALNVAIYLTGKSADNRNRAAGTSVCIYDTATGKTVCTFPTSTPTVTVAPIPTYGCSAGNLGVTCIGLGANNSSVYCQQRRDKACNIFCDANCGMFGPVVAGTKCTPGIASDSLCTTPGGTRGHIYQNSNCDSVCIADNGPVPTQYLPASAGTLPGTKQTSGCASVGVTQVGTGSCFSAISGQFTANLYTCPPGTDVSKGCQMNPVTITSNLICLNNSVCGVQQLDVVGAGTNTCFMSSNSNTSASCIPPSSSGVTSSIPTGIPLPTATPTFATKPTIPPTATPTACPVSSSISCRPMTDTNPNFRCKMVTDIDACGVKSFIIGDNCCPTNPPTKAPTITPTATPTICIVPTAPYCPNGQLINIPITPGGPICSQFACINKDPTPVCVMPTPPVCTNGKLVQVPITPGGRICAEYVCVPNTPTLTPTKIPTITPSSSVCKVSFNIRDTAVCWKEPRVGVPTTFTVHSLPSTGGPYYVQTDWYIVLPNLGPHHYVWTELAVAGKTYTINVDWPGIPTGYTGTVENHAGVNIVDKNGTPVSPNCTGGMDYYWTPYVNCPELTPTASAMSCTNWGVNEKSGTGSTIVKLDARLSKVTTAKQYLCTSGYCEIESMEYDGNRGLLFAVPNIAPKKGLYTVNTNSKDSVADGTLTLYKAFVTPFDVAGLTFKKNDPTKAWMWRNGYGLYTFNMTTGATVLEYGSTYEAESIAWDNNSRYMYISGSGRASNYKIADLWRYDPTAIGNKIAWYAYMPGITHSMSFGPSGYLGGMLIAYNESPGNNYYTYDVVNKKLIKNYPNVGINGDAFAACVPNNNVLGEQTVVEETAVVQPEEVAETVAVAPTPTEVKKSWWMFWTW